MQFNHLVLSALWVCIAFLQATAEGADRLVPQQYATIQAAIDASTDGDVVMVSAGTYQPIDLRGKSISVQATSGKAVTTIDGSGLGASTVNFGIGSTLRSRLAGFTIKAGMGTGSSYYANGGGVYCPAGSATLEDCDIVGSTGGTGYGGGLRMTGPALVLRRCRFISNWSYHDGGGVNANIKASNSSESIGGTGSIRCLIEDCEFRNCYAYNVGGLALSVEDSSAADDLVLVRGCLFSGNVGEYGGSSLFPSDVRISGAAGNYSSHQVVVDRCVLDSQTLSFTAGAYFEGGYVLNLRITNCIATRGWLRRSVGSMELGSSWLCQGVDVVGGFTSLGGNSSICVPEADCNANGRADAFDCVLGAVADANRDLIPDDCQPSSCQSADLTQDGVTDGSDLGALLCYWGLASPAFPRADINRDGSVDGTDLGYLLSQWGPCTN